MLLSFVANEDITEGTAVAVLEAPLGVIRAIDPLNFADARSVGIAVDTVSSGALCRVISKGEANFFDGSSLEKGITLLFQELHLLCIQVLQMFLILLLNQVHIYVNLG